MVDRSGFSGNIIARSSPMSIRKHFLYYVAVMAALALGASSAQASSIVYQDYQLVTDPTVTTTFFDVTSPGIYKAELVDFEFPEAFDILSLGITQGLTPLGFGFDTGSFTFQVTTPGTLGAHLAAIPMAGSQGLFALSISSIAMVPVPSSVILLMSGVIGLVAVGRREYPAGSQPAS
jgi:hypothetical protein